MSEHQKDQDPDITKIFEPSLEAGVKMFNSSGELLSAARNYWLALFKYQRDFSFPMLKAMSYFNNVESLKIMTENPIDTVLQHTNLLQYNGEIFCRGQLSSLEAALDYHAADLRKAFSAWLNSFNGDQNGETFFDFISHTANATEVMARRFPQEIRDIADEYGFHFERGGYELIEETDRFMLYQVLPTEKQTEIRQDGKPILIVHPYVLGADILAFLPSENKSYVHCFANQGIPTYVRILKDIEENPAAQSITLEDDIRDMKFFCERIKERHGRPLTLNGYCQGGLITLANLLSGELDDLVDTHLTCVAPIDGTRSPGFANFLGRLPQRFNDLAYGTKKMETGNLVADGDLMSWVYKIKSIEDEAPLVAFYRDLAMIRNLEARGGKISKTVAALNYWIFHQRHDLPLEITKLSFASYNTPISEDGTLPFRAFGRELNMKRIKEKKIPWLICYGESDRLVEKDTALAPLDHVDAEVTPFPKGHVAIATSWSLPTSEYALHMRFGEENTRGPVRFHLDVELEEDKKAKQKAAAAKKSKSGKTKKSSAEKK